MTFGWTEAAMLIAMAAVVPLGFRLLSVGLGVPLILPRWAFLGVGSVLVPNRPVATVAAILWLAGIATAAWPARGRVGAFSAWLSLIPIAFLTFGAVWFAAGRAGYRLFGFVEPIVTLTGVHFHFAGFALPVVAVVLCQRAPSRLTTLGVVGALAATPMTALGILLSPTVEVMGALWVALTGLALAGLLVREYRMRPTVGLIVGAAALTISMPLAAVYAYGEFSGNVTLTIPVMLKTHGALNAFGFALPTLWGLRRTIE